MAKFRFIQSVILSCTTQEQLQSCISWVQRADIPDYMRDALKDVIRSRAKFLIFQSHGSRIS